MAYPKKINRVKEIVCELSSDTEDKFRAVRLKNVGNTACDILLIFLSCSRYFIA